MDDAPRVLLKTIRESLHLTQRGLGQRLGVATRTVSRWELGTTDVPATVLPRALDVLRASNPDLADQIGISAGVPSVIAQDEARREALDHAVYVAADALDISPRRARGVLATFLTHLVAAGITPTDARARLMERTQQDAQEVGPTRSNTANKSKK